MTNEPSAKRVRIQEPELNEIRKYVEESADEAEEDYDPDLEGWFGIVVNQSLHSVVKKRKGAVNLEGIDSEGSEDENEEQPENEGDMFAEGAEQKKAKKVLGKEDIEGQEWSHDLKEEEQAKITPFNMDQEMEEGY